MTARLLGISFLSLLLAAACGGNKNEREGYAFGCPTGMEKKIRSKDALLEAKLEESGDIPYIEVTDLRCSEGSESLRIEVDLMNTGSEVHRVAYRFRWLDKDGMAASADEVWKPLMVYGKTRQTISTTSPGPDAVDFRVMLRGIDQ
ncbi:MAG TPA: YcfL family protein [Burkholderiales bacterium]